MTWGAIGATVVGGIMSGGQKSNANQYASATQFKPFNVSSNMGSAIYDPKTGNTNLSLSPMMQALQGSLFGGAGSAFNNWKGFDVNQASADAYKRMNALAAPGEQQTRTAMENRLFAQGRLGTTGGAQQFGNLLTSQGLADIGRQQQAVSLGQMLQQQLLQSGLSAMQGGVGLGQIPLDYAKYGGNMEAARTGAMQTGAAAQMNAANSGLAMQGDFWNQALGSLGGLFGGSGGGGSTIYGTGAQSDLTE